MKDIKKDIKIRSISLKSFKGFDDITIDCAKNDSEVFQWTVLLGNNNTGKTRILQAIAGMPPLVTRSVIMERDKKQHLVLHSRYNQSSDFEITCKITDFQREWTLSDNGSLLLYKRDFPKINIFGYGVGRYPLMNTNLSGQESFDCDTLFSHEKRLINIEEWLIKCDYLAKSNNPKAQKQLKKLREVICSNLFPEIEDFKFESTDKMESYVLFKTKDGWFKYTELGFGYQSMLSWIVDLSKRMFDNFPDSDNPLNENAVVLVDEIDLHLHPKWQREVISYVSEIFKNVQFIVTTHSPLVIQSMQDVNLYVLRREENGKIAVEHSSQHNFSGWTVEEILRDTMNLDSDIHSDFFQNSYKMFEDGLDNNDVKKAQEAYKTLEKILHPSNPLRSLLELQFSQMENHD